MSYNHGYNFVKTCNAVFSVKSVLVKIEYIYPEINNKCS